MQFFSNQVRRDNGSLKVAILLIVHLVNTLLINKPVMPGSKELKDDTDCVSSCLTQHEQQYRWRQEWVPSLCVAAPGGCVLEHA